MNDKFRQSMGFLRFSIAFFLTMIALFALFLDYFYESPQWIIANDSVGRLLAYVLINLGPEIAIVGLGVIALEYLIQINRTINN